MVQVVDVDPELWVCETPKCHPWDFKQHKRTELFMSLLLYMPLNRWPGDKRCVYPLVLGELWLFSLLGLAINIRFQILAIRGGHGAQRSLKLLIAICSIHFSSASTQIICTILEWTGNVHRSTWNDTVFVTAVVEDLALPFCVVGGLLLVLQQMDVKLLGGCSPHPSGRLDFLCVQWTLRLIFMVILLLLVGVNMFFCHLKNWKEDCSTFALTNWRQDLFGWIPRPDIQRWPSVRILRGSWLRKPQVWAQSSLPPTVAYTIPAAGPNNIAIDMNRIRAAKGGEDNWFA